MGNKKQQSFGAVFNGDEVDLSLANLLRMKASTKAAILFGWADIASIIKEIESDDKTREYYEELETELREKAIKHLKFL